MKKRTYRTSEQWAELFNSYEHSGLTIADYCQENDQLDHLLPWAIKL